MAEKMAEKNVGSFKYGALTAIGQKQTEVRFKATLKDGKIEKVLCVNLSPYLTRSECFEGQLSYGGKASAKILLTDQDGKVVGLNYTVDFDDVFKNEEITPDSLAKIDLSVIDCAYSVDTQEISVSAIINAAFFAINTQEKEYVESGDFEFKTCDFNYGAVTAAVEETFTVGGEAEIDDNIVRVLSAQSQAVINSASVSEGVLTVDGEAFLNLVYLSGDGNVKNAISGFLFSRQIATGGIGEPFVYANVKSNRIHLDVKEEDKNSGFQAEITLEARGFITQKQTVPVICDAYSATHKLDLKICPAYSVLSSGVFGRLINAYGEISLANPDAAVALAGVSVDVVESKSTENGVTVSGTVDGTLLYTTKTEKIEEETDEEKDKDLFVVKTESEKFSVPFSETVDIPFVELSDTPFVQGAVKQAQTELKNGVLSLDFDVALSINIVKDMTSTFVCGVTKGEPLAKSDSAIEVCIVNEGDSVWEVAKSLNMTVADILKINPELTDPVSKDDKIVIYHQKTA